MVILILPAFFRLNLISSSSFFCALGLLFLILGNFPVEKKKIGGRMLLQRSCWTWIMVMPKYIYFISFDFANYIVILYSGFDLDSSVCPSHPLTTRVRAQG